MIFEHYRQLITTAEAELWWDAEQWTFPSFS